MLSSGTIRLILRAENVLKKIKQDKVSFVVTKYGFSRNIAEPAYGQSVID